MSVSQRPVTLGTGCLRSGNWIEQQLRRMRKERSKRREGARGGSRHTTHPDTDVTVEDATTVVINEQSAQGEKGDTDQAPDIGT